MIFDRGHCHQSQGTPRPGSQLIVNYAWSLEISCFRLAWASSGVLNSVHLYQDLTCYIPKLQNTWKIERYICIAWKTAQYFESSGFKVLSSTVAPVSFAKLQAQRCHLKSGTKNLQGKSPGGESYGTNPQQNILNITLLYTYIYIHIQIYIVHLLEIKHDLFWLSSVEACESKSSGFAWGLFALRCSRLQDLTNISQVAWLQPKDQVATRRKSNRCYLC